MLHYYKILEVEPNASKGEIKKAYRRKAMQYHPDRNRAPGARRRFLEVLEAYEYLIDNRQKPPKQSSDQSAEKDFDEIMREMAQKRAREKYRERVREFRRKQAEEQSKEFIRAIYVLVTILVLTGSFYVGRQLYRYLIISMEPVETYATVVSVMPRRIDFTYSYNGNTYRNHLYVGKTKEEMTSRAGMPLHRGDAFVIRFNGERPDFFDVHFHRVSEETLQRYFGIVGFRLIMLNHENWSGYNFDERQQLASCIISQVYTREGVEGLSQIYHAENFFLENFNYNSLSWLFFSNGDSFKELVADCKSYF
jgi:hypothetical protein